jgi:hypothetical protein
MLEQRALARAAQAYAAARRFDAKCDAERSIAARGRKVLASAAQWRAEECASVHARSVRGGIAVATLRQSSRRERERANTHLAGRMAWGRLRRGLERRVARSSQADKPWHD